MADNRRKPPPCPRCGAADTYRYEGLLVRPALYGCDWCLQLFTTSGSTSRMCAPQDERRAVLRRWDQLADDAATLAEDIRGVHRDAFTDAESHAMISALGQTVSYVMINQRPKLPPSKGRDRKGGERHG